MSSCLAAVRKTQTLLTCGSTLTTSSLGYSLQQDVQHGKQQTGCVWPINLMLWSRYNHKLADFFMSLFILRPSRQDCSQHSALQSCMMGVTTHCMPHAHTIYSVTAAWYCYMHTKAQHKQTWMAHCSRTWQTCLQPIKVASIGKGCSCLRGACSRSPTERGYQPFHLGGLPIGCSGLRGAVGGGNHPMLDQPLP